MLANNETGVIQPLREIVALAQAHGAWSIPMRCRPSARSPVNFGLLGVDLLTVSAHKLGGPIGVGALVVRDGLPLEPLIHGGGQELRRRAGTENLVGDCRLCRRGRRKRHLNIKALRDHLENQARGRRDLRQRRRAASQHHLFRPSRACRPKPC